MAEDPLQKAVQGRDVTIEWVPFELHPFPGRTPSPEMLNLEEGWDEHVYPTAKQYGIQIALPRVSPQPHTHLAFQGLQYAKEYGKAQEYNQRVFEAYFQKNLDIGRVDVLTKLATDVGLDEQAFQTALETGAYKETHKRALIHSYYEANITAVPTFLIGRYKISGLVPREKLEEIIDKELQFEKDAAVQSIEGLSCGVDGCEPDEST